MAVYIPDSDIYFCNVDLDSDYSDTRGFTTKTQQQTWFLDKVGLTCSDYNYQKKDERIYVNKNIRIVDNYNYVFWINHDDEATYIYAFITDLEYINRNTTAITFRIDVFQSFIFDSDFHQCAIERIIPAADTPGKYFLEENVLYGPNFRIPQKFNPFPARVGIALVVSETDEKHTGEFINSFNLYNGVPCMYTLIVSGGPSGPLSPDNKFVQELFYYMSNRPDSIISIINVPIDALPEDNRPQGWNDIVYVKTSDMHGIRTNTFRYSFPAVTDFLDDFVPVNNKMLCYPYSYLELICPDGQTIEFKRQNSLVDYITLEVKYELSANPRIFITPSTQYMYSKDPSLYTDNTIVYTLPQGISTLKDYYAQYLQQNANRLEQKKFEMQLSLIGNVISMALAVPTGGISSMIGTLTSGGGMMGSILDIQRFMAEQKDLDNHSPTTYIPSNSMLEYWFDFSVNKVFCSPEVAPKIDEYFKMYGYKVKEFAVPSWNNRTYWDYIKTYGCSIKGNYAQQFARELESVFNNGIRIWHTDDIGNYNLDNA